MIERRREVGAQALVVIGMRYFVWLALSAVAAPVVASAVWHFVPDRYEVTARVVVQEPRAVNPFLAGMLVDWTVKQRLPLIESVMRSHATLEHVLRELGELPTDASARQIATAVDELRRRVEVIGLGGGLVKIKMRADTSEAAYKGTQLLVSRFTEEILRPQKQAVQASAEFLRRQADRLRGELSTLEGEVTQFRTTHATELPELQRVNFDEHVQLRKDLVDAEVKLAAAEKRRDLAERKLREFNPLVGRLEAAIVDAEVKRTQLRVHLSDDHPQVQESAARIAALRDQLSTERAQTREHSAEALAALATHRAQALRSSDDNDPAPASELLITEVLTFQAAETDVESAQGAVELLRGRLDVTARSLRDNAGNEESLNRITRDLDIKLGLYRGLLEKYEDALVTREVSQFDEDRQVWTVEGPVRPSSSLKPPLWLVLVGALFGGVAFGAVAVIGCVVRDDSIRGVRELSEAVDAPCLGRLPRRDV